MQIAVLARLVASVKIPPWVQTWHRNVGRADWWRSQRTVYWGTAY